MNFDLGQSFDNLDETEVLIDAELCRQDFRHYVNSAWPILEPTRKMVWGWPVDAISEHLEACEKGQIKRLLINVPPGSMKSLLTRVFFPTWVWTRDPSKRFIGAAYAQTLAERDNLRSKTLITDPWYQARFPVKLNVDQQAKSNFLNTDTGFMLTTSIGGIGTGIRGDYFMIDDPHNVLEADSPKSRAKALFWFRETVPSRLNDMENDVIIVIMQRVHEEDISGAAIELGYDHLMIPMHYDPDRAKPTSIGWNDPRKTDRELMWPARFSAKSVDALETALGPYAAASQLEQTPVPREGGMLEVGNIETVDRLPKGKYIYSRGWDLAGSDGKGAFTVGILMAFNTETNEIFVTDVRRGQLSSQKVRQLMGDVAELDAERYGEVYIVYPKDPGQAGKAQAESIATTTLLGYTARAEVQSGSKEVRADSFAAQVEAGNVSIVAAAWNKPYLDELRFFPKGKYMDQVDATASAFNEIMRRRKRRKDRKLALTSIDQSSWARGLNDGS